ncbi:TonB-linked SusC/RagA family outer membrane protein [Aquimarina sp. MAR_2010_214]|uniref:SusC/RagA family TonB-linked outer membrane protein n=1 Tax=Aquimarina sp. MAR_2010_214 TaxID=1250026 RepID=UPI000C70DDC2|nr:TonB-dependent receptor [Aquimarina sp. MAR_2010_214]PKV50185.1 TonB-linked SusC/RagA family outer membrane protein [Aquimarina sp. MAR_2010_214]
MKNMYFLIVVFLTTFINAQETQIRGNVVDNNGMPLPGVNVFVKNTNNGVATDFDGNYLLTNISKGNIISFSYIGFASQEIIVGEDSIINIILDEENESLEQIVVIGYGSQKKKELTGAVSVITSENIEKANVVRIEQALQGQVSGVHITSQSGSPGSTSTISIRGISTNVDSKPLILVDGNVIEDLSVLNPNDVESINVLKDATAGIYGVRAANGVILITTKSGRKNRDLKFQLDSYTGFQEATRKIPTLNATEYGIIINESFAAGGGTPPFSDLSILGRGTDWQDEIFRTAVISNINFSANGGGTNSSYAAGTSYLTQDGIVGGGNTNFNRFTGRMKYNLEFLKNFRLSTSAIFTQTNRKTLPENALGSVLFNALNMSPNLLVRDENGDYTLAEGLGNEVINPVAQIANTFNDNRVNKIGATIGLKYNFLQKFAVESNFQFNYAEVSGKKFFPEVFYGSGKVFNVDRNNVTEDEDIFRDYTWDNFITYDNTFADNHNLKVLLGMSVFKTEGIYTSFTGYDVPDNSYTNANISQASDVIDNYINGSRDFDSRLLSYFSRLQYNFKGKYLLSAVIRRDGSTKFGPENKFGYFPSGSIGWIVSDESFMKASSWLDFLKLRASYGIIGNDRIPDYRFVSLLNGEGTYVIDGEIVNGLAIGALSNPKIKWEKQKTLDIGLDTRFINNKLKITFDYFKRRTEDLLVIVPVSGILGSAAPASSPPVINAGTVENKGYEFQISYNDRFSKTYKFNINYNITTLKNEVITVSGKNDIVLGGSFGVGQDPPSRMETGKPIGYFYGLQTDGIFQNQTEVNNHATQTNAAPGDLRYVDVNKDGQIDSNDRTNIGNPIPDITMGLNVGFNYKNFDFSSYTYASLGNDIVRNYERNQNLVNRSNSFLGRWTGEGTTNSFPRVTTGPNSNSLFSSFYVEDGSYLRIQNVQLGYTMSDKHIESIGIDKFRIYVSVNNLYTFTEYKGYDPSASSGAPIGGGIDQGFYPVPRTYLLGLNLKF